MAGAGRAGGSPQRQLSLALLGLRACPGPAGGDQVQSEGALQSTLGLQTQTERQVLDAGLFYCSAGKHPLEKDTGGRGRQVVPAAFKRSFLSGSGHCRVQQVPYGTLVQWGICARAGARRRRKGMEGEEGEEA